MRLPTLIVAIATSFNLFGASYGEMSKLDEDLRVKIWSNETAPHSNNIEGNERYPRVFRISKTVDAELFIFFADKDKNCDKAVVLCPGGGYGSLAMDNEGALMAKWFAQNGITAAVLKYRMPNGVCEVPFEDAVEAIRIMRHRATEFGYDPSEVGICGASAGGHLAASVSTMAKIDEKPNFSILFYPVISSEEGLSHKGSFDNLLGMERSIEQSAEYSLERRVDENTPPAILFHCSDDKVVPAMNSVRYFSELMKYDNRSSLYIFPIGGHGWGNYDNKVEFQSTWQTLLLEWLDKIK